jgi:hydrogenase maturation factor
MRAAADLGLRCEPEHGCITCGDEAARMRVIEVDERQELALCADEQDRESPVDVGLVASVQAGEALLVHAGVALARLEERRGDALTGDRA